MNYLIKKIKIIIEIEIESSKFSERIIEKVEKEVEKSEPLNALTQTFRFTPFISNSLFQKLGVRLNYDPLILQALHNILKNNGDYIASFFDEEEGQ